MDKDEPPAFDGSRLREIRESRCFSRQELADKANLSRTYIHLLEGDRKSASNPRRPSLDVLWRLALALDVRPTAFASSAETTESATHRNLPLALAEAISRFSIPEADAIDLAHFSLRGRQPRSARDWGQLWLAMLGAIGSELAE